MKIIFHPMKERPMFDCEVFIVSESGRMFLTNYDKLHDEFNYSKNSFTSLTGDYIGWAYADELRWQMVEAAHEIKR